jgi:hypothetical protein
MYERADGTHSLPESMPEWARTAVKLEHERRNLPPSLRRKLRAQDKAQGIGVPPPEEVAGNHLERLKRLLLAMAD